MAANALTMIGPGKDPIIYDHPLNERVRTLLRLEDLFAKTIFFCEKLEVLAHHCALLSLFEIVDVTGRGDLKSDLLQELERQKHLLESLRDNPAVAQEALRETLREISTGLVKLRELPGKTGQHVRDNDWLMNIKQRSYIAGGVCEFELPSYHFWLNQAATLRQQNLNDWLYPLLPIYDGLRIVLRLLRGSGQALQQRAQNGAFQLMLSGKTAQMLRVGLAREETCVPEISANKYAINIRFINLNSEQKARPCENAVDFNLTLCTL